MVPKWQSRHVVWVYCFDIIWHILLKLSVKLQALQINIYINIFIFINRYLRNQFLNVTFIYHRVRLVFKLIIKRWEKRRQDFYVQTLLYHSTQHCNKHDSSMTSVSFYPLDIIELLIFENSRIHELFSATRVRLFTSMNPKMIKELNFEQRGFHYFSCCPIKIDIIKQHSLKNCEGLRCR